jgi:hypothetical protein
MWGGIVCNANLIKSNIFVFLSFLHPLFFKVRSLECELMNWVRILNSEFFFFEFGTPWVRYLNIKGFFLKFLGVNEDFQRAREVNPSFGYIKPNLGRYWVHIYSPQFSNFISIHPFMLPEARFKSCMIDLTT